MMPSFCKELPSPQPSDTGLLSDCLGIQILNKEQAVLMPTPEQQTQLAICDWLSFQHPHIFDHIIKIDNEGIRSIAGHVLAKKMGLHKGASDLFIAWPTIKYYGMWLEIKRDGWKGPSGKKQKEHHEAQLNFIDRMNIKGYFAKLAVGVDEGILAISEYLKGN
jgi:hypothetical protein